VLSFFGFDALLKDPGIIPVRLESFEKWKASYVHAYRKAHRAYYQQLKQLDTSISTLKPKTRALVKMNAIVELGPPLPTMSSVAGDLAAIEGRLYICPRCGRSGYRRCSTNLRQVPMDSGDTRAQCGS
jgi:hypothetical protein